MRKSKIFTKIWI